jgi:hydrogenase expression/formation protein HypE
MKTITLSIGSGGKDMHDFINDYIVKKLGNDILNKMDDACVLVSKEGKLAFTTDSYVVSPIFFDGGDIGRLCVCGTVNDLATSGAIPVALSLAFILEDGAAIDDLCKIIDSIARACKEADVKIVTGDTKVVEKGKGDRIYINTAGIGFIEDGVNLSSHNALIGDQVIVTGTIGDHEVAMMKARELINLDIKVQSDAAPLNLQVQALLKKTKKINVIKDPTRGGLASALFEIANNSNCEIRLIEETLPISTDTRAVCSLLGLDPLYLANEGKFVILCPQESIKFVLDVFGKEARVIGSVISVGKPKLNIETFSGGIRRLGMLDSVQLPRIC